MREAAPRSWKPICRQGLMCKRTVTTGLGAALILAGMLTGFASAGARVEGQIDRMQLLATNASVREVLDALPREFNVTYQLPHDVQRQVSGSYSGTLTQILARI